MHIRYIMPTLIHSLFLFSYFLRVLCKKPCELCGKEFRILNKESNAEILNIQ